MFTMKNPFPIALIVAVGLTACSPSADKKSDDYYVRIVSPDDKAVLSGLANVKVEISIPEEATSYEVGFDGDTMTQFDEVTGKLRLNTNAIENGNKTLRVTVTGESGAQWSDSMDVQIKNATYQLTGYRMNADAYAKGEEIVLTLTYPVPGLQLTADFLKLDDQFSVAGVTTKDLGGGQYELHYVLSSNDSISAGRYEATITATNADNEAVTTPIDVMLRSAPRLPINIKGATFVDEPSVPFSTASAGAPTIQSYSGAGTVIAGTPNNLTVTWAASTSPADRVIVRSPDYSGYYVVPVNDAANQQATIPLELAESTNSTTTVSRDFLKLLLATVDASGATGGWTPVTLTKYHTTATGTLVTLWWDNPVDFDLSVTDPLGNTISYSHNQADGGSLELDSNAMCHLDYMNTERVSWPVGSEVSGTYTVSAKIYDACGQSGASYHVLVNACGQTQEVQGSFSASDVSTASAMRQVATFNVNCSRRAHGSVMFEQPKPAAGLETRGAAFIPIRAITGTGSSRQVIAESTTAADGSFDFYLPDSAPTDYSLEAEASWTPPGHKTPQAQVVGFWNTQVYRYTITASSQDQASASGQIVYINKVSNSGAFNILDSMEKGFAWVSGHFAVADAAKIKALPAHWTMGQNTYTSGSYYSSGALYINGVSARSDEFDDSVVSHEFMHHVLESLGATTSAGGEHYFSLRATPSLAWDEGAATAMGQQALGYATYWDVNDKWVAAINLEYRALFSGFDNVRGADLGTDDGKKPTPQPSDMTGNVSEILVAAVLWDLMDPIGNASDAQDQFDATYSQTLGSIASYLPPKKKAGRGATGIDLVDFLDGWRCRWPVITDQDTRLHMLLDERQFPYDYSFAVNCQ